MKRTIFLFLASAAALVVVDPASAQQSSGSGADLAKAAQNPLASMISLPFQNNTNINMGPNDRTQNVLNIQPVIHFGMLDVVEELELAPGGLPIETVTDAVWTIRFQIQLLFPR